jgi:hypothetical protein
MSATGTAREEHQSPILASQSYGIFLKSIT